VNPKEISNDISNTEDAEDAEDGGNMPVGFPSSTRLGVFTATKD
jgi:hypothetical protein